MEEQTEELTRRTSFNAIENIKWNERLSMKGNKSWVLVSKEGKERRDELSHEGQGNFSSWLPP